MVRPSSASKRLYQCGTCGKSFPNIVAERSHQARVCSIQPVLAPPQIDGSSDMSITTSEAGASTAQNIATSVDEDASNDIRTAGTGDIAESNVHDAGHGEYDDDEADMEVDLNFFQLSHSVMSFLDGQYRVADDVFNFYDSLTQHSEFMVPSPVNVPQSAMEMPSSVHCFLDHCITENLTQSAIGSLYNVLMQFEENLPEQHQILKKNLPSANYLCNLLNSLRLSSLYREKWMVAVIDLNDLHRPFKLGLAVNRSGTFRCPLQLAVDELQRVDITELHPFRRSTSADGHRSFSSPIDGLAFEAYSEAINGKGHILCVDIYADGVAFPKSGTQTMCPLRVRYPNINNLQSKCFDIGLCPILDCTGLKCSAEKGAELRRELLHRYLFLVLRPLIQASRVGIRIGNELVFPRILMTVCDQKQERPFVCLRSTGATRDCTLCDMVSKVTKAEERRHREEAEDNMSEDGTICRSQSNESLDVVLQGDDVDLDSLKTQLSPNGAAPRNVVRTLGAQLVLSIIKVQKGGSANSQIMVKMMSNMSAQWFQLDDRSKADIRKYVIFQSCCKISSVFGAIHGLGTEPYLLFHSIAFDTLHVMDLGVVRLLPDQCHSHFSSKKFTNRPAAQCISIANRRLVRLPRGAHLPKNELFLNTKKEKLAGITGLVRRSTLPFLWLCLLRLNDKVVPDTDPLVQSALELAYLHAVILGTNDPAHRRHKTHHWIMGIQDRCFQLGVQFVELFNFNVNTKLHRFMRHIHCHLTSFGMLRWGANDYNESRHKAVKKAYALTNRRPDGLALQLLQAGYADQDCQPQLQTHSRSASDVPAMTALRQLASPIRCTHRELGSA